MRDLISVLLQTQFDKRQWSAEASSVGSRPPELAIDGAVSQLATEEESLFHTDSVTPEVNYNWLEVNFSTPLVVVEVVFRTRKRYRQFQIQKTQVSGNALPLRPWRMLVLRKQPRYI